MKKKIDSLFDEAMVHRGLRFKHLGRSSAEGLDCLGLVLHAFYKVSGKEIRDIPQYRPPHFLHAHCGASLDFLKPWFSPIRVCEIQKDDLLVFALRRQSFLHLGIYGGEYKFVHSHYKRGVEHTTFNKFWRDRLFSAYRIRELNEWPQ